MPFNREPDIERELRPAGRIISAAVWDPSRETKREFAPAMPRCCGKTPPMNFQRRSHNFREASADREQEPNAKRKSIRGEPDGDCRKGRSRNDHTNIRTLGHFSDDEGKYQSEDAARRSRSRLFKKYEASCRGAHVPKRLTRQKRSLVAEAALLREIKVMPKS